MIERPCIHAQQLLISWPSQLGQKIDYSIGLI